MTFSPAKLAVAAPRAIGATGSAGRSHATNTRQLTAAAETKRFMEPPGKET
jgi:hypothetical protein